MAKVSGGRLRPGDVLETDCDNGLVLLGYVGRHAHFGDLILVPPRLFTLPVNKCSVFDSPAYFQFLPATASLRQGLLRKVAFCPEAIRVMPSRWRNIVNRNDDGTIGTWTICDGNSRLVRHSLTEEERQLPVGEIVNLALLLERLRAGWTPDRYQDDNT